MTDLSSLYDNKYRSESWRPLRLRPNAISTTRYDDVARLISSESSSGSLLEVGCGAGQLSMALADRFSRLVGIDLAPVRIKLAQSILRERYPGLGDKLTFTSGDASTRLPFEDASFDVVLAVAVIEHVVDVFAFMDEIVRVCRPGGCVLITTPNICYVKNVAALLAGRVPLTGSPTRDIAYWREHGWDGGHLHYFSKASLADLLISYGLQPESWTGDGRFAKWRRWQTNLVGQLTVRARKESRPRQRANSPRSP